MKFTVTSKDSPQVIAARVALLYRVMHWLERIGITSFLAGVICWIWVGLLPALVFFVFTLALYTPHQRIKGWLMGYAFRGRQ